jgi:glycosyltransferase involved in cell wall biosynthesis
MAGLVPSLVAGRALLLTPSSGLGGGIERYAETLQWAFAEQHVECDRVSLRRPGAAAHARLVAEARAKLVTAGQPTRLVLTHRALLPAAWLLAREPSACGVSVICHGSEVWGARSRPRSRVERRLMSRPGVRVVAASSFTAGALSGISPATVLSPGLSGEWFRTLAGAASGHQAKGQGIHLVSAFRLADWRGKGLPELLAAVAALGRGDVRVTVCGKGEPAPELRRLIAEHRWCALRPGVTDSELAGLLASADLLVLATRTRFGQRPSGEGFGLVLLEAQVAGTPVVAPAYGGSHDAFVDQVTGAAPADETAGALTALLDVLLKDPLRLELMGKRAAEWARERFAPERYAARAVARLL